MTRREQIEQLLEGVEHHVRFRTLCLAATAIDGDYIGWARFVRAVKRYLAGPRPIQAGKRDPTTWTLRGVGSLRWDSQRSAWLALVPPDGNVRRIGLRLMTYVLAVALDGQAKAKRSLSLKKPGRPRKRQSKNARRSDSYRAYHQKYQLERYHRLKCQTKTTTAPHS